MAQVTAKEKGRVNMKRSVKMEHCFGGEETHETTGRRKHQGGSSALLRIGKKIHEGKIYLKQLLLMDRFAVKRYGKGTKQFTKQENNLKG